MTELLTAAQMRALEQAAIDSGEVTGLELMERAGRGVLEAILEEWPEMAFTPQKAVVLCGPGNNGGDGFVVARLLKQRGWEVEVFLFGEIGKLPPDAKANCERWRELGTVYPLDPAAINKCDADLWIDAVFGTGLTRPLPEPVFQCFAAINEKLRENGPYCCVIDVPSGLCADSGRILEGGRVLDVDLCVAVRPVKVGLLTGEAPFVSKVIRYAGIGLDAREMPAADIVELATPDNFDAHLSKNQGHKYTNGHALVVSGPAGRTGAARLAAWGALRIGAGLVSLACPQEAMAENAAQLTAIMLSPVEGEAALHAILNDRRINALCLGPALGHDARARELVVAALESGRPMVLDADALSEELIGHLHEKVVLTPHGGEFARMFPDIAAKLAKPATTGPAYSKVDATRAAAKRAGCTVLYKGADTIIADQTGRAAIHSAAYDRAAPWLATAGSGDVLAGFITGLLARGFAPMQAAETAAWLHVECALKFGPGLIAEDIPEQLPAVFRDLGL